MIQGIRLIPAGHYFRVENGILSLKRYNSLNLIKTSDGYAKFITKLP